MLSVQSDEMIKTDVLPDENFAQKYHELMIVTAYIFLYKSRKRNILYSLLHV